MSYAQTRLWNGVEIKTHYHGSPIHMWYAFLDNYCEAADAGNPLHGIGETEELAITALAERLDELNPLASWIGSDGKKYRTDDPEQVERMIGCGDIKWVVVPVQIRALDPSKWTQDEIDATLGIS